MAKISYPDNKKLLLKRQGTMQDVVALSALIDDIHRTYPDKFIIGIDTNHQEIWKYNKNITEVPKFHKDVKVVNFKCDTSKYGMSANNVILEFYKEFNTNTGLSVGINTDYLSNEDFLSDVSFKNKGKVVSSSDEEADVTIESTDSSVDYLERDPTRYCLFYDENQEELWQGDMYKGSSCFLVLGGPSFGNLLEKKWKFRDNIYSTSEILNYPGHITMAVNNAVRSFRPDLWTCVDNSQRFMKSIYTDPKIKKFVPMNQRTNSVVFDSTEWKETNIKVKDCPNVIYYKRNALFNADQFLFEETVNWGNSKDNGGGRSVMLASLRILYDLGFSNVYLLGCDMKMDKHYTYHFDQSRAGGAVKNNNNTFKDLQDRFEILRPIFEKNGMNVYNCNSDSALTAFDFKDFSECISESTGMIPDIYNERTDGLYSRKLKDDD